MSFSHNNFFTFLACLLFAQAMPQIGTPVSAQSIAVESRVVGKTPRVIGINSGNFKPGSNAITWWKWLGVNGARIFVAANRIESKDDIAPHGDGVTDKDENGNPEYRIWDKDVDTSHVSDIWKQAMELPRDSLPWIIVSNGKTGISTKLPDDIAETKALAGKYLE